jgi:hypothetical protein
LYGDLPSEFEQSGPGKFKGSISRALPLFVEREYKSKGLRVAPDFVVVNGTNLPGSEDGVLTPFIIGLSVVAIMSFLVFVGIAVPKMQANRNMARETT